MWFRVIRRRASRRTERDEVAAGGRTICRIIRRTIRDIVLNVIRTTGGKSAKMFFL
jgi:hypothetical protein